MLPKMSRVVQPVMQIVLKKLNRVGLGELGLEHYLHASFVVSAPFADGVRDVLEQCRSRLLQDKYATQDRLYDLGVLITISMNKSWRSKAQDTCRSLPVSMTLNGSIAPAEIV